VTGVKYASRQVGVTRPAKGPARGLGGDHPGGDACFGPRRTSTTLHGLTTENSAQIPRVVGGGHRAGFMRKLYNIFKSIFLINFRF